MKKWNKTSLSVKKQGERKKLVAKKNGFISYFFDMILCNVFFRSPTSIFG